MFGIAGPGAGRLFSLKPQRKGGEEAALQYFTLCF